MSLNFRRGFFRLWLALAVLWIGTAVYINWEGLGLTRLLDTTSRVASEPWEKYASSPQWRPFTVVTMPDGTPVDFGEKPVEEVRSLILTKFPDFDFGTEAWLLFEARKAAIETARGRRQLHSLVIIFAPPFVLFVLGVVLGWIARGFRTLDV